MYADYFCSINPTGMTLMAQNIYTIPNEPILNSSNITTQGGGGITFGDESNLPPGTIFYTETLLFPYL